MPKYLLIQQPTSTQKQGHRRRPTKQQEQQLYQERLRELLGHSKGRTKNKHLQSEHKPTRKRADSPVQNEEEHQRPQYVKVLREKTEEGPYIIKLPHIGKKNNSSSKNTFKQRERKLIMNYMNAKLVRHRKPLRLEQTRPYNSRRNYLSQQNEVAVQSPKCSRRRHANEREGPKKLCRTEQIDSQPVRYVLVQEQDSPRNYKKPHKLRTQASQRRQLKPRPVPAISNDQIFPEHQFSSEDQQAVSNPLELETYIVRQRRFEGYLSASPKPQAKRPKMKLPPLPSKQEIYQFIKSYNAENNEVSIDKLIISENFQLIESIDAEGNRQIYCGQVQKQMKHGCGILFAQSYLFEGFWQWDQKLRGLEKTQVGKYVGQFSNGKREGQGEFTWSHGEFYSGEWKDGKKNGSGFWKSESGETYLGEWKEGSVDGYGILTMKNGQKYEGQFLKFKKHGHGKQSFPNGDTYQGKYCQGYPHGRGIYAWKAGQIIYEGDFQEGYRHGSGFLQAPGILELNGIWKKQVISGLGSLKLPNGDRFHGMFQNNKKNGFGILSLKNENKLYKGIWAGDELVKEH